MRLKSLFKFIQSLSRVMKGYTESIKSDEGIKSKSIWLKRSVNRQYSLLPNGSSPTIQVCQLQRTNARLSFARS